MPKFFGPGALLDPSSAHSAFSQGGWEQLDFSSLVIRCEIWHCFPVFPIFEATIYSICGKNSHTFPIFPPHLSPVWAWSKICKVWSSSKTVPSAIINLKSWLFLAALLHFTLMQHKKWLFDKIEGGMVFPPDSLIVINNITITIIIIIVHKEDAKISPRESQGIAGNLAAGPGRRRTRGWGGDLVQNHQLGRRVKRKKKGAIVKAAFLTLTPKTW